MKNLNSEIEGVWIEQLELTTAQLEILQNGTQEEKQAVIEASKVVANEVDTATTNSLYNLHKPTEGTYHLIGCNLTIGENTRGIINYRINREHKQIRIWQK